MENDIFQKVMENDLAQVAKDVSSIPRKIPVKLK
jgi:hypothetical protein